MAACSGDDDTGDAAGTETEQSSTTSSTSTTTTTQPSAADADLVRPHIEELLGEWDRALGEILADPVAIEADPAHPLRVALAESFTADSPYVEDLGLLLASYIDQDTGYRPAEDGAVQETSLQRFTRADGADPDFVSFVFCTYIGGETFRLSDGEDLPPGVAITNGAGQARRVDGEWRLHRLQQLGFHSEPPGTANPCPDLVGGDDGG